MCLLLARQYLATTEIFHNISEEQSSYALERGIKYKYKDKDNKEKIAIVFYGRYNMKYIVLNIRI